MIILYVIITGLICVLKVDKVFKNKEKYCTIHELNEIERLDSEFYSMLGKHIEDIMPIIFITAFLMGWFIIPFDMLKVLKCW